MICLGIETTAHTFGVGIAKDEKILANVSDMYVPEKGGIHPMEAKEHHEKCKEAVLKKALEDAKIKPEDIDVIAYSAGPGLPPCLMVGTKFAKDISSKISKPVIGVNHCIAHIEIGKLMTGAKNPVTLYVSGGNTQVIAFTEGRYRVFGETLDKPIGSAIDTFIRETGGRHPGGPVMQELAKKGEYIKLPYVVKGMDLSFSGIATEALQKFKSGAKIEDLCYSFQETCYAMLTEVTERAVAHTGKKEVLLTGGVAASQRLQEMIKIMCQERGDCKFYVCPRQYAGDCGANIAWLGILCYRSGYKSIDDFNPRWRTDEVNVTWL